MTVEAKTRFETKGISRTQSNHLGDLGTTLFDAQKLVNKLLNVSIDDRDLESIFTSIATPRDDEWLSIEADTLVVRDALHEAHLAEVASAEAEDLL